MSAQDEAPAMVDHDVIVSLFAEDSCYVEDHTWAVMASSTILGFGKLSKMMVDGFVLDLLRRTGTVQVSTTDVEEGEVTQERLAIFRKLREGFLKASALVGFPRVINTLNYLQTSLESNSPAIWNILKEDTSIRTPIPQSERQARGYNFFTSIYGKHADRLFASLNERSGGDLGEFALNHVYSDLISETSVLGKKETGLLQFICCLSLGQECAPQAKGHMYGARALGNNGEDIRGAIRVFEHLASVFSVPWEKEDLGFLEKANDW